jgi:DNA-binding PadR family transcriptional regulator
MNSTRLFVLNALAQHGSMYGHQIRRVSQLDRTELWTDIKPGSLYGALHRMAEEGVIDVVRTEQEGKMPARTVYAITPAGKDELIAIRDEALRETALHPDPVDLALTAAGDLSAEQMTAVISNRRAALVANRAMLQQLREYAEPHLTALESITFEHSLLRLEAEIAWHDRLLTAMPALFGKEGATGPSPRP